MGIIKLIIALEGGKNDLSTQFYYNFFGFYGD